MNTEFIKRLIDQDTEAAKVEVDKINETFKRANYDVRTLLGELKPTTLEAKGLPAALQEYIERIRVVNEQIEFVFEAKGVSGMTLANEAKGTLFNIVQESINNAIKYASPKHIWDDGKGFDVEESKARAKARGSYGLSNLVDRAALINGVTQINSEPGKGTKITVHVPLEV
jgi:signal transduction histidine kinase